MAGLLRDRVRSDRPRRALNLRPHQRQLHTRHYTELPRLTHCGTALPEYRDTAALLNAARTKNACWLPVSTWHSITGRGKRSRQTSQVDHRPSKRGRIDVTLATTMCRGLRQFRAEGPTHVRSTVQGLCTTLRLCRLFLSLYSRQFEITSACCLLDRDSHPKPAIRLGRLLFQRWWTQPSRRPTLVQVELSSMNSRRTTSRWQSLRDPPLVQPNIQL